MLNYPSMILYGMLLKGEEGLSSASIRRSQDFLFLTPLRGLSRSPLEQVRLAFYTPQADWIHLWSHCSCLRDAPHPRFHTGITPIHVGAPELMCRDVTAVILIGLI